jgi:hypothetical protein
MDIIDVTWGARVCLGCFVMWGFEQGLRCWWCGRPGLTIAQYEAREPVTVNA